MDIGGGGRNRTGVDGFAGRCMTTLPPRLFTARPDGSRCTVAVRAKKLKRENGFQHEAHDCNGCLMRTDPFSQ